MLDTVFEHLPDVRYVIAYGAPARRYIESHKCPERVRVFVTKHFRSESYDVIDRIAAEILGAQPAGAQVGYGERGTSARYG